MKGIILPCGCVRCPKHIESTMITIRQEENKEKSQFGELWRSLEERIRGVKI